MLCLDHIGLDKTMPPGKITCQEFDLGTPLRLDGQQFEILAMLYEMPAKYNYWMASYDAAHERWGHMRFALTVPKKIIATASDARTLVRGAVLDQVKSVLQSVSAKGGGLSPHSAAGGWALI